MPRAALRPTGRFAARVGSFATATSAPACAPTRICRLPSVRCEGGCRSATSFAYAYIGAAALVTVTASSIGLVTSVPLTRAGLDSPRITRHVVSSAWLALVVVGAVAGAAAVAGAHVVGPVLGSAYGGHVGTEIARLVLALGPWMIVSVGVTIAFPLVFVVGTTRAIADRRDGGTVRADSACLGRTSLGRLDGLALSLGLSAASILVGLLRDARSARCGRPRGLALAALTIGAIASSHSFLSRFVAQRPHSRRDRVRPVRRPRRARATARARRSVALPPRAALTRASTCFAPAQARAAPVETDEREAGLRAEDPMPRRGDGALGGRQVAERHAATETAALPVEGRELVLSASGRRPCGSRPRPRPPTPTTRARGRGRR